MTGFLHEKEFSRKTFVKGSGALIVGLSIGGLAGKATAANTPNLPPDQTQLDTWLSINADSTVTLYPPKLDFGQGTWTGFRQIVADELDVAVTSISIPQWDSASAHPFPDLGATVGSSGTANGGPPLRRAAAEARQVLLTMASAQLGVPAASLTVSNGVVSGGGKSVSYGQLVGGKLFNATVTGNAPLKPTNQYKVVGTRVPRFDIPSIVTGEFTFIQNVRIPGMLHGRPVRPRGQANVFGQSPAGGPASFTLVSVDEGSIKHLQGVQIVRKGNFVGVVAAEEFVAIQAAAQLKVTWSETDTLPGSGNLYGATRAAGARPAQVMNIGDVDAALKSAAKVVSATYQFPVQIHGPIGPIAAIADVRSDGATIFLPGQDTWGYKTGIAKATGLALQTIRIVWFAGASTFNREPNTHAAVDAAIMSQIVGKPVRVQHMRWDTHGYEAYGHHSVADIRGGIDANGKIVAYDYVSWLPPTTTSFGDGSNAPGNQQIGNLVPPDPTSGSSVRGAPSSNGATTANAPSGGPRFETFSTGDQYAPNIPNRRVTGLTVPNLFRTSPLRAPDCIQPGWASESMIDELAYAAKMDPIAFRRAHMTHDGWLGVLDAVAKASNWQPRVAASSLSSQTVVTGRGFSQAGENHANSDAYSAVIAEIQVNKKTGKILVKHLYGAQDSGVVVNPASIENQLTGMMTQGVSRTLVEEMTFSKRRVTGLDWTSYPMLRFKEHPSVTPIVISHMDEVVPATASSASIAGPRYRGGGESLLAAVPAAIGNAFFDATGVRMRQVPLTPPKVRAALKAAGVA
jgi:nicotinate dehydrogenase subunit B